MADVDVAASSPAAGPPPPDQGEYVPLDLGTLTAEQYDQWRQTGKTPEAVPPKPAESAPATDLAPKGETAPDSKPEPKIEEPKKPKGAEARKEQLGAEIQEILGERREALRQLDEVRATLARERGDKPSAPPAAQVEPSEPLLKDFLEKAETYEAGQQEFQRAHSQWAIEQHEAKKQAAAQERTIAEQREAFAQRVDKDAAGIEDFDVVMKGPASKIMLSQAILAALHESEIPAKLLYHLAKDPQEFARITALTPAKAILALGKIEEGLLKPVSVQDGKAPPPKPHSGPPPPPTELTGRQAAADEVEDALASGDFGRYQSEANARELKRKRA